jgi:nitrate/nitrite-specific signal transduction histidine kinase
VRRCAGKKRGRQQNNALSVTEIKMNSVESEEPIESIESRIEQLEFLAGNYDDRESLTKQVDELQNLVDGMYGMSKPLQSLYNELDSEFTVRW